MARREICNFYYLCKSGHRSLCAAELRFYNNKNKVKNVTH